MVGEVRPLNIFFSYPHDGNGPLVERLKADLEARGHKVWLDTGEIRAGEDWRARITRGIQESERGVAFLSRHATRDPGVCLNEIAIGLDEKGDGYWASVLVEPFEQAQPPVSVTAITWLQSLNLDGWRERTQEAGWYHARFDQLVRLIEHPAEATRDADIERLRACLRPMGFSHELGQHVRGFTGRQWVFEAIDNWLDGDARSRVFRIEGGPGLGKTALALNLTHRARSRVIAVHLCRYNQGDSRNAARMVMNLAFQLATRLPDYRARLLRTPLLAYLERGEIAALGKDAAGSLWRELIAQPLAGQIPRQRLALVIDAMDEATEEGGNEIVSLLAKDLDQLPSWAGVVLTGRPDPEVVGRLSRFRPVSLRADDPLNRADLQGYLDAWLAPMVARGELGAGQRADAERVLLERSGGSFLYLRKMREAIEEGLCRLEEPERLPHGLADTYALFFERRFGERPTDPQGLWKRLARPLLELVLASPAPLPATLARELLGWDDYAEADALQALGSLFPRQDGALAPFHNSVREWLQDAERCGPFRVDPRPARLTLGQALWKAYCSDDPAHHYYALAVLPELLLALEEPERARLLGPPSEESCKRLEELVEWAGFGGAGEDLVHLYRIQKSLAEALLATDPGNADYARNLSKCLESLEKYLNILRHTEEALDCARSSLKIAEELSARAPENDNDAFALCDKLNRVGDLLDRLLRKEEALDYYRRGLKIAEEFAARAPENAGFAHNLSKSFITMSNSMRGLGRSEEALDYYRRSLKIREELATFEPEDGVFLRDLYESLFGLYTRLETLGRTEEALYYYDRMRKIRSRLVACAPDKAICIADRHVDRGGYQHILGENKKRALDECRLGVDIFEELVARAPENPPYAYDLSKSFIKLGDSLHAMGRTEEALDYYRRSLKIAEELAARAPKNADFARGPTVSFDKLGDSLRALGRTEEALDYYRRSLKIREELAAHPPKKVADPLTSAFARFFGTRAPENADYARDLSVSFNNLGDSLHAMGRTEEALDYYRRSLKIREELAARAPENAGFARDLSVSFNKLGDSLRAMGRTEEALDSYRRSLKIREELAARAPENAGYANRLITALGNVGYFLNSLGRINEAIKCFQQGCSIARRLDDRDAEGFHASNLGSAELKSGNDGAAQEALNLALDIARETGYRFGEAARLAGLAMVQSYRKDHAGARDGLVEALTIARETGDADLVANILLARGVVQHRLGSMDKAVADYREALALDRPDSRCGSAVRLGIALFETAIPEERESACAILHEGIESCRTALARSPGDYETRYTLLLGLIAAGQTDNALEALRQAWNACSARGAVHEFMEDLGILERASLWNDGVAAAKAFLAREAAVEH